MTILGSLFSVKKKSANFGLRSATMVDGKPSPTFFELLFFCLKHDRIWSAKGPVVTVLGPIYMWSSEGLTRGFLYAPSEGPTRTLLGAIFATRKPCQTSNPMLWPYFFFWRPKFSQRVLRPPRPQRPLIFDDFWQKSFRKNYGHGGSHGSAQRARKPDRVL